MKLYLKNSIFLLLSLFAVAVYAAPQVELQVSVEKDRITVNDKGEKISQRVPADEVVQGDTLFYTIHYKNVGDESATNVQLDNPIADGTSYQADSAWGKNAIIQFTVNGKDYQAAAKLKKATKTADGKTVEASATADDYTAIRWLVKEIKPGAEGKVGFNTSVN